MTVGATVLCRHPYVGAEGAYQTEPETTRTTTAVQTVQVLSIVTVAVAFVAMAGSIFGMNLYFNVTETPPVSFAYRLVAAAPTSHGMSLPACSDCCITCWQ